MTKNLIKQNNLKKVKAIFKKERILTKAKLAELSNLSVVTVNSLIKTLVETKEVIEDNIIQPELGRPCATYRFNEEYQLVLIVSMNEVNNSDTFFYSVCNLYGVSIFNIEETPKKITSEYFIENISMILSKYPAIKSIGFSIPGVEYNDKVIICDYSDLDKNFPSIIKNKFNVEIFFENDINMALFSYCKNHNLDNAVGIYMPSKYPPGSAIYYDNKIIKGFCNLAGEIMNLPPKIDWETFSYSKQDVEEFLIRVIQTYICVYNPQSVIIYSEIENLDLKVEFDSEIEKQIAPEIIIKDNLNQDSLNGMVINALSKLAVEK